MRRRSSSLLLIASAVLGPVCTGCGRRTLVERYPSASEGRFVAQVAGRTLLRGEARATYCRGDSILVIVVLTPRWTAGLAFRGAFPVESARTYSVDGSLGAPGTATAAFRAVTDSVETALVGAGGTARLDPDRLATGRFDVQVPAPDGRTPPRRILGAFRALPTADTAAGCGLTPRTP
jgi:hypothetical protein